MEIKLMEEILLGIKDLQITNLQILSKISNIEDRLTSVEDRLTSVEDRLTSVEESQILITERVSKIEQNMHKGFANVESKINTLIVSNQLMNYTYESIVEDHNLHAKFLLSMSKRITNLENKNKSDDLNS